MTWGLLLVAIGLLLDRHRPRKAGKQPAAAGKQPTSAPRPRRPRPWREGARVIAGGKVSA